MDYIVTHNTDACRFEILMDDGQIAYLDYDETEVGLVFAHTYVPKAFEGRGVAASLVKFGLEYAQKMNIPITPSCPYVVAYIKRHPEYEQLVK
ncbi:MAG: GNAT family N-acetyltransferase [Bacteroidales bacterium]|nr:GNAT family N-acetyltransferase [Bacteroidales bacterium]MDD4713198.1 GNAT family N-acetyltransferase [Bacteroidales bacterium]